MGKPGPEWPPARAGLPGLPMLTMMEVAPRPARAGLAGVHSWRLRGLPARFNRPARPVAPGLPARLVIIGGLIACGICPERRPVAGVASGSSFRSKPAWRNPVARTGLAVNCPLPLPCPVWKAATFKLADFP